MNCPNPSPSRSAKDDVILLIGITGGLCSGALVGVLAGDLTLGISGGLGLGSLGALAVMLAARRRR